MRGLRGETGLTPSLADPKRGGCALGPVALSQRREPTPLAEEI